MTEPVIENVTNLLATLPDASEEEILQTLLEVHAQSGPIRIERITSHGQHSPEDFWYDQDEDEWVLLLQGAAAVEIAGEAQERRLGPGDALYLPAHRRHRVAWTAADQPTVWLALFWRGGETIE